MSNMNIEMKVKVSLTANEWELYTSVKGAAGAARKLNTAASKAITEANKVYVETDCAATADTAAWAIFEPVSRSLSPFGANDSEPRYHFEHLLRKCFYKPHDLEY